MGYHAAGSGKTHSMSGREDNPGIVPRLTLELFERVEAEKKRCPEKKFLITCSYLEIYNETVTAAFDVW